MVSGWVGVYVECVCMCVTCGWMWCVWLGGWVYVAGCVWVGLCQVVGGAQGQTQSEWGGFHMARRGVVAAQGDEWWHSIPATHPSFLKGTLLIVN